MTTQKPERLLSLDIFRGVTIAGMILVNNPGSWGHVYPALAHAKWHGCTPTDLIFPFFLFIVGVAVTLSLKKRKERGDNQTSLILNSLRRAAILFGLGIFLASFPYFDLTEVRIPGVLQRIAIVYLITSVIFLKTTWKTQAWIGGGLLLLYWAAMSLIPVPGVGYANLEPTTNLAAYFDNLLLKGHMWKATKVWDPEGILSTIPAISTCISGVLLGHWLQKENDPATKTVWIFVAGIFGMVIGYVWDGLFPMNKSLWTSSYVAYTTGLALVFFAMIYWLVDVRKSTWWTKPFIVYGMNAITVFFLSGLMARSMGLIKFTGADGDPISLNRWLYTTLYTPYLSDMHASLAWALSYVLLWLGILWVLYVNKIFVKV